MPWFKSSFPKPNLQRRLIFIILILHVFIAATLNVMSFLLNWEDTIQNGVRSTTDFWDLGDSNCEDHPWSRSVYLECERSSGIGAVGSSVRPADCIRVCNDDPCATSRRIAATISVSLTIVNCALLVLFLALLIFGLFVHVWLPLVAALFTLTIVTSVAAWLPFWLSRHGYVAGCPGTDFCPNDASRCDVHGFAFMTIVSILLAVGGTLTLFFDCIFLRFCGRKVDKIALEEDEAPVKEIN